MAAQPRKHQRRESDIDVASHARAMGTEEAASPSQLKRKLSLNTNARAQPFPSPATYYSSQPHPPPPTHRRSPSMMEEEDGSNATDSPSNQPLSASTSKSMPFKVKGDDGNAQGQDKSKQPERTGRACLACRRLKTRCDGAEDPPCRRCKQGGHECVFVESKRGKRPVKKPAPNEVVAEKLKTVEQTLTSLIHSMNQTGQAPDLRTMQHLQELSASGVNALNSPTASVSSLQTPSMPYGQIQPSPRVPSNTLTPSIGNSSPTVAPTPSVPTAPPLPPSNLGGVNGNHLGQKSSPGAALSLLAEASLAAELDGRTGLTGLDPHFRLSSLTGALAFASAGSESAPGADQLGAASEPPALLTKRIIDPTTAVELFRLFFDFCYLHLPILDPSTNTATAVCSRSPFLFTVICAVGSRFHHDRDLERACYDEAHTCFVSMIARGERAIDSVHACLILTVWAHAPTCAEDRPRLAWLYFSAAVRLGLELGLFRPPNFSDKVKMRGGVAIGSDPWGSALQDVPEDVQRDALNRERTWLLIFIVDRYISAVMGRPPTIHECKSFLLPSHPLSLPFDLGIIAHLELQSIVGQVMETFRDRIFGHASANDEMPSPVVLKLFNARMEEWRMRWARTQGDPVSANLLFYFHNSVLYLNSIPLQSMLRNNNTVADPDCVSKTVTSAKAILDIAHEFGDLGVLRHCPDVTFLYMLFANVFLVKLKLSNTSFSALLHTDELFELTRRAITDCASIATGARSAAGTSGFILSAIYNSFRANSEGGLTSAAPSRGPSSVGGPSVAVTASASGSGPSRKGSIAGTDGLGLIDMGNTNSNTNYNALPPATTSGSEMTLAPEAMSTPGASAPQGPFFSQHAPAPTHMRPPGLSSGANTPSAFAGMHHAMGGHSGGDGQLDGGFFDSLLTDSLLVSQGEAGFLPNMWGLLSSTQPHDAIGATAAVSSET